MRILVMDDYRPHGESLTDFLQTKGHQALYAETFTEAEWLLRLFPFEMAVLDFDMPDMTGPAVAARLTERLPGVQSVIISALPLEEARQQALGGLLFLQKPVSTAALLEVIRQAELSRQGFPVVVRGGFSVVRRR